MRTYDKRIMVALPIKLELSISALKEGGLSKLSSSETLRQLIRLGLLLNADQDKGYQLNDSAVGSN